MSWRPYYPCVHIKEALRKKKVRTHASIDVKTLEGGGIIGDRKFLEGLQYKVQTPEESRTDQS